MTPQTEIQARQLPPLLQFSNGSALKNAAQWPARRMEILAVLAREEYGRAPQIASENVHFERLQTDLAALNGAATLKRVRISTDGPHGVLRFELVLFVPNKRDRPAPTLLLISHRGKENLDPTRARKTEFWPVEELIARGYGTAAFFAGDVDPDENDGFRNGAHGVFDQVLKDGEKRAPQAWGTIAAWAWGASRALDYLETDAGVDKSKIGVVGHSRGGKAALWAGASDPRFALTVSNCSGSSGAALSRGKGGETIAQINQKFPHWFARTYHNYNDCETQMPFDQHWLLAAIAPRLLYVVSAQEDAWADPQSEFLGTLAASPAWELNGSRGLVSLDWAQTDVPLQTGNIGYHRRSGGHGLTSYDWKQILNFCDAKWQANANRKFTQ